MLHVTLAPGLALLPQLPEWARMALVLLRYILDSQASLLSDSKTTPKQRWNPGLLVLNPKLRLLKCRSVQTGTRFAHLMQEGNDNMCVTPQKVLEGWKHEACPWVQKAFE